MAGTSHIADLPPLPLAGEGRAEGIAPHAPTRPEVIETALTLPSPASGRGFDGGLAAEMTAIGIAARAAARLLATAKSSAKATALREAAAAIRAGRDDILA